MVNIILAMGQKVEDLAEHYKWRAALRKSRLFNAKWYHENYPDVKNAGVDALAHYLAIGWRELRNPGSEFNTAYYLQRYPDVASLNVPPLVHYELHGRLEGRHINSSLDLPWIKNEYREQTTDVNRSVSAADISRTTPEISVIVPTYNRISLLQKAVSAWREVALHSEYPFELIFSDDGSNDGSVEYLESVADLPIVVLRNDHGGASAARNAAILRARGERLLLVGDDIFPDKQIINVHARLGRELGKSVATLGLVEWADDLKLNHLMTHITEIGNEQFSFNRLESNSFVDFRHFYTCNICIDRSFLLKQAALFDHRFDKYGFEDTELGYRLSLQGMKIFYTTDARGQHYHPYEVKGFCKRQTSSGEMAVVFRDIHPGVGQMLGIGLLETALSKLGSRGTREPSVEWQKRVDGLVARLNALEDLVSVIGTRSARTITSHLTLCYTLLFRAMYDFGVLKKLSSKPEILALAMERHFNRAWDPYWEFVSAKSQANPDLSRAEVIEVLDALSAGYTGTAFSEAQTRAYRELELLGRIDQSANATKNIGSTLKYRISRILYWLREDPRYLLKKLFDVLHLRRKQPLVVGVPGTRMANSRLALIVDAEDEYGEMVENFRSLMGADSPIFVHDGKGGLRAENDSGHEPQADMCYLWFSAAEEFPNSDHIIGAWLTVIENNCDVALISLSLEDGPLIHWQGRRNGTVFSHRVLHDLLNHRSIADLTGKIYRTNVGDTASALMAVSLAEIFDQPIIYDQESARFHTPGASPRNYVAAAPRLPKIEKTKPCVFIFPIFVAVGGVERNTIEIVRKLRDHYDFVVITMERLRASQGSLAAQFQQAGARVIEMAEIVPHSEYLRLLIRFRSWLSPDLIWICNGSPWLGDNAHNIRNLFRDIPIVDQQVYDVREGWINRYHEPGIRTFDRFIAINQRIKDRFVNDLALPIEKVDLIYSAVDASRIAEFKSRLLSDASVRRKLGLPADGRIFTFVGRLTNQKRPIEFLKLAKSRLGRIDEIYVLIGDGELAAECAEFIERERLTNVLRIPYISNTLELASVTSGLVITSAYEGLPIAMLEVLNFAVPVFATDTGDIRVVLDDYQGGVTIPVDLDGQERELIFDEWHKNLTQYKASLLQQSSGILERFSSDRIAQQYIACFDKASLAYAERNDG